MALFNLMRASYYILVLLKKEKFSYVRIVFKGNGCQVNIAI